MRACSYLVVSAQTDLYRKIADGLFLETCKDVAKLFPTIQFDAMIVDNTAMQVRSSGA